LRTFSYLFYYNQDEPVNSIQKTKGAITLVTVSNKFVNKILIDEALLRLPETYRVVLELHYIHAYSVKEVAEILNMPLYKVYRYRKYGINKLKNILTKEYKSAKI